MRKLLCSFIVGLALAGCQLDTFEPFEFFYSISAEKAVIISLLPGANGIEMRTRVYPEDGEIGVGEVASLDVTRELTSREQSEVQALFQAVDFAALDDGDYIPPLDASLWAINTTETGDEYFTVLEPGEETEKRHLAELVSLGAHLWALADLQGSYY